MKRVIYILIASTTFLFSCYEENCVQCDIYDQGGSYIKDYGEFCGDYDKIEDYEADADWHANYFYGGWAECYRSED